MAGTRVPGQRAVREDRGAMERDRPRRRLAQAPSRAAAACTPTRRPAEQPLKRRQRGAVSAGAKAPGQWPLCSGAHGCDWVRALVSVALPRAGALSCPAPSAELGPSRGRLASRGDRSERRPPLPGQPPPWHAGPWPTSAPPPPALAALRSPLRPPRRFPARRIPGNCARLRPALPLGLLGLVVRHSSRPRARGERSALASQRAGRAQWGAQRPLLRADLLALLDRPGPSRLSLLPRASSRASAPRRWRASPPARAFVCYQSA